MTEWDGLEARLKDLGENAAQLADDSLEPAVVRERGARRRQRRWAATTVAVAAMMISGGAGVYALTAQRQPAPPAGIPSHSPSVERVEHSVEPSAQGSLLPPQSVPRERHRSVPVPYTTPDPSTSNPGAITPTPTPTPSEPTDTPSPTLTEAPEPPPTSAPSVVDPGTDSASLSADEGRSVGGTGP